jgi:hypothetical protein
MLGRADAFGLVQGTTATTEPTSTTTTTQPLPVPIDCSAYNDRSASVTITGDIASVLDLGLRMSEAGRNSSP